MSRRDAESEGRSITEYVHQELNEEITAIGGHYVVVKEARLAFAGREVLYAVGFAAFDTSCCGVGGYAYALVPGFIVHWRDGTTEGGLGVSQVEPIRDEAVRERVRQLIEETEPVHQVIFQ